MWRHRFGFALVALVALALAAGTARAQGDIPAVPSDPTTLRAWIAEMKQAPRGPFARIRWFCQDGSVLPPRPYGCADHGGGIQHGEWTPRVVALRDAGYEIANVLAELEGDEFVGPDADLDALGQILIERFLVAADDGWIYRRARSYRGALQIEDEEAGARRTVLAMLRDPAWREPVRFLVLREVVRWLPLQADASLSSRVRQLALVLAEKDSGFEALRAKIHSVPDAGDAATVRAYAERRGRADLAADFEELAEAIDELYAAGHAARAVEALAARLTDAKLAAGLRDRAPRLARSAPEERLAAAGEMMVALRNALPRIEDPETALAALHVSLALEDAVYAAGSVLSARAENVSRRERLAWLENTAFAVYGAGFIGRRELSAVRDSIGRLDRADSVSVGTYRSELRYLSRVPEWAGRWLEFHFGRSVARFVRLEPLAHRFPQDRLRGSPLLLYGAVMDSLVRDANRLAGIEHDLFGERVGAGLRALNPGLARGVLHAEGGEPEGVDSGGIYLLPETTSDLPPVAGILTRGEGSSLSHVQLLARNLGIPNVVVGEALLGRVREHDGTRAVLAVSPNGVVQLVASTPRWDAVFGSEARQPGADVVIRPDLEKLDLEVVEPIPLDSLRATDSGRVSGPKGANLGELRHAFGAAVPDGLVVPFGVFRRLLDQPLEPGGPPVFEWMKRRYAAIAAAPAAEQAKLVPAFLTRLRAWIEAADPGPELRTQLREMLARKFGKDGSYGVFVRSDTNVEDLPGFTGAGLNLTVPNVVGFENVMDALGQVWASPFTERAYAWRQAHMEQPEYVFPAVVVQYSFPAEKSGVMVTTDVDGGQPGWISVAVNEGVGGAVEGQSAESLRIHVPTGEVRLLAPATAPQRAVLSSKGGVVHVPASGGPVLEEAEIRRLAAFAREVPQRFPSLRDAQGRPMPADVEFAFRDGRLALLQIRPFVESRRAQRSQYLSQLDAEFRRRGAERVELDAKPAEVGR